MAANMGWGCLWYVIRFACRANLTIFFSLKPEYATYIPFTPEQDPSDPYNDAQSSAKPRTHRYRPGAHDGWTQCAKALREHDDIVVNAWKEGIDTLLVFVCRSYVNSALCVRKLTVDPGRFVLCRPHGVQHRIVHTPPTVLERTYH